MRKLRYLESSPITISAGEDVKIRRVESFFPLRGREGKKRGSG
jgi:hypothetical protein